MGQLPAARVTPSRPFTHVGVDFCGPFITRCLGHRSAKHNKSYGAFFICLSTRAVHIEIVSDLSCERFLDAFRRFIARRGLPNHIYNDNGTNFVGASNQLFREHSKVLEYATGEGINWHFITPRAPHQGGLWEAAIKSGKSLLIKAARNHVLTYEELLTILCQVESILNSRPLCYRKESDKSVGIITPGHFLIGDHLLSMPLDNGDAEMDVNLETRLKSAQAVTRIFWNEWRKTYLNMLQQRNKWFFRDLNIKVDDVVIIKEDNVPVLKWPVGRVIEVYPDAEGIVRNVTVRISVGVYNRAINRIIRIVPSEEIEPLSRGECLQQTHLASADG